MPTRSPEQWLALLEERLNNRLPRIDLYERYRAGDHRLLFATSKFREAFGDIFGPFATNWCALVVDAAVERMAINGFRFGDAEEADEDAWSIWQDNGLDAGSLQAHTTAVNSETAYLLVAPPEGDAAPRITVEHPSQVVVAHDPADRRRRLAALKRYRDENGDDIAVVYEPDRITVFKTERGAQALQVQGMVLPANVTGWSHASTDGNPLGVVPVVPLENNPDLLCGGVSDLRPAISLNDAANKFFLDMLVASEYAAFPQRVLTGVEILKDPDTGEPMPGTELRAAISRVWAFEDPQAKAYDLKPASLDNYVQAVDLAVQHLAAQTRTPPHYLLAKLVNISGDALTAAETGLVSRVRRKHIDFSDPWEEAMRLAFRAVGDDAKAGQMDAETMWRDPETRAPGVISDSLVKKSQIGVPWQALMEEAGYSPQQIRRMKAQRDRELLEAEALSMFNGLPSENGTGGGGPVPAAGEAS